MALREARQEISRMGKAWREGRAPPSPALPHKLRGGGRIRARWGRVRGCECPSRCDGGPLPRRPFRSFLATAADPSPNFGGGVGAGGAFGDSVGSPPLPHFAPDCRPRGSRRAGEGAGGWGPARMLPPGRRCRCVRDARPEGREPGANGHSSTVPVCAGGSAQLGTVVSCPTARAARPGAQRRDTPRPCTSCCSGSRTSRSIA
jgi:hypothetical protein